MSRTDVQAALSADLNSAPTRLVWSEQTVNWVSPQEAGFDISAPAPLPEPEPVQTEVALPKPTFLPPESSLPKVKLKTGSDAEMPRNTDADLITNQIYDHVETPSNAANPYSASSTAVLNPEEIEKYPGVNRLTAFLIYVGYAIIASVVGYFSVPLGIGESGLTIIDQVVSRIVLFGVVALRYVNMGKSGFWCFALLIPFYSIWVLFLSFAAPPGYFDKGSFDRTGWVLGWIFLATVILSIISIIMLIQ